jgi:outer membrane protein insertion porin family
MRVGALVSLFLPALAAAFVFGACIGLAPAVARAEDGHVDPPRADEANLFTPVKTAGCVVPPAPSVPTLDAPPNLTEFAGKPIVSATAVLEGNVWDDVQAPAVTGLSPGDLFSPAAARRAMDALLGTGGFARGRVTARAAGDGVALTFSLVPRKLIGGLRLDLHDAPIDREEMLRDADLSEGGEIIGADLAALRCRIQGYFQRRGYPDPTVTLRMRDTDDPARALVYVDVNPGPPRLIGRRDFYVFDEDAREILQSTRSYPLKPGDRADAPALDNADTQLAQALHTRGYNRARVSHDLVQRAGGGPAGGASPIALRVRIDAGPVFVQRFEGNESFDADVLHATLGVENETDRSNGHLADKLRAFYVKRGFLDVEVRPVVTSDPKDRVQLTVFRIREGARVTVAERSYPCLKLDAIKHLHDGGPSSPGAIGTEIDSYLDEELPGADLFVNPDPRGVNATIGGAGSERGGSSDRALPLDLKPEATYLESTYERAALHVQELYRNEGFLHAEVGPVRVVRARCDPRSPAGRCIPLPAGTDAADECPYDRSGLPATIDLPSSETSSCTPDPTRGVLCAPSMRIVIPVRLGPRTRLWDVAFTGVKSTSERAVADAAQVQLGEPVSTTKLDEVRRRIVDWYKEAGYAYVDVKYTLEPSPDNTRARVRFDVAEGDQVTVRSIVIRGLVGTKEGIVRRRIALTVGRPFVASDARKTQERIATLGVFTSVTISLSDPYVPQPIKDVIIDVAEREPQYVEVRPGFSTGEGVRGVLEYGHRNLLGEAFGITVHLQASYLPDFLILDPQVAANYGNRSIAFRTATRDTITMSWPEIGLGPTVRGQLDGVIVRDLERDFTLDKGSVIGTLIWRPTREFQVSGGPDYEHNDIDLFQAGNIAAYLALPANQGNTDLQLLLRVPDGASDVFAGHVTVTWDRRDNAFNAHKGTYAAATIEEVNSYPVEDIDVDPAEQYEAHFLRLTQTVAGYLPLTNTVTFAAELRLGEVVNITQCKRPFPPRNGEAPFGAPDQYCTYPDRLFFMGGFESMRGWLQDSFIPQEYADRIASTANLPASNGSKFTVDQIPLRGGNLMINPRFELRFPVRAPVDAALFADFGNLWNDPSYMFAHGFSLRADVGAGMRVQTPVGPLVFDYGINVTRRPYEDFGAFHFAIGLF